MDQVEKADALLAQIDDLIRTAPALDRFILDPMGQLGWLGWTAAALEQWDHFKGARVAGDQADLISRMPDRMLKGFGDLVALLH